VNIFWRIKKVLKHILETVVLSVIAWIALVMVCLSLELTNPGWLLVLSVLIGGMSAYGMTFFTTVKILWIVTFFLMAFVTLTALYCWLRSKPCKDECKIKD
jgi:hypothetical protein